VNGKNATLMTRQQIIDEIADDRVRLVSQFRHDPANQGVAASVPFQINRAVRGLTMDFSPAVGPPGALMFSGNQIEPLELRISHDLFPQRSTPGRDDLDHCLHPTSFSRKSSLLQRLFGQKDLSLVFKKRAVHHVNVDIILFRMSKRAG
jgi:hypothetical protein